VVIGTAPPPAARGVDVQQWRSARALDKTRIILFLGRIHEKKGCDLLIRSFRDLQSMGHRYHLVIAGPDESGLEEKLRDLAAELGIADMITWTGLVKGSDKWSLLRCADVLVLPSHQENFGLVVSEALACGVPVLLTYKVGVWPEVVADGAGLADEDTQGGITRLLMRWATMSDEDKAAMRSAAERCFNERYHVKRVAQNYVALVGGIDASLCVSRPIG
jgi:glycosyltransferase involved in cell wall biosynthesis